MNQSKNEIRQGDIMENEIVNLLHSSFEGAEQTENGVSFWRARDIMPLLEYARWENFEAVIEKAKISCQTAEVPIDNHFRDVTKMIDIGSDITKTSRPIKDILLTRYACYLIAQNGDPRKEAIAFAQSYFALQTRKQELLQERLQLAERINARSKLTETEKQLSSTLYQHGVDDRGFGEIRSRGDNALFGNNNTAQMKARLGIKSSRALADFLPTVTLEAKNFAAAITDYNVRKTNMRGKDKIGSEHVKNNMDVRAVLAKSDIKPENLPPEEDIQKLERRVKAQSKQQLKGEGNLSKLSGNK